MHITSEAVEQLVEQFSRLPTIGRKTAQRLAAYVLKMPREDVVEIARALVSVKDKVKHCAICNNITDTDPCPVCRSTKRDHSTICVVEEANDVMALERTNEFRGVYHVLGGVISPLDGVGPDDLAVRSLVARVAQQGKSAGDGAVAEAAPVYGESEADAPAPEPEKVPVREVILALNPTPEGDTTAFYLAQLLQPLGVSVTRIARGLPIGGDVEFADEVTLTRALEGRGAL